MRDGRFDWSDAKERANFKKHGVTFEAARLVFDDSASIDEIDDRADYGEDRFVITGRANGYTERDGRIRIISARKATRREQDDYFSQDF